MNRTQVTIVTIGLLIGIGLFAFGLSHPGCDVVTAGGICVKHTGVGDGLDEGTDRMALFMGIGIGVIVLTAFLAFASRDRPFSDDGGSKPPSLS